VAESFPTPVRYSGHAAVTTVGNLLGGSVTPALATVLLHWTGTTWSIAGLLVLGFALTLAVLPFLPETRDVDIEAPDPVLDRPETVADRPGDDR
jgi:hypothetical protein